MIDVTLQIGASTRTFQVPPAANLLQAAIAEGLPLEYVCKQGRCCTCKIKVLDGAKHLSPPTSSETQRLGRDKIKRQWRLACQVQVNGPVTVAHRFIL
jgi:ferredoxin